MGGGAAASVVLGAALFFFSSRRRHTRLQGDWSSDVCSSDLGKTAGVERRLGNVKAGEPCPRRTCRSGAVSRARPPRLERRGAADKPCCGLEIDRKSVV